MSLFESKIKGFFGEHRFLSNFYPCTVHILTHEFEIEFDAVENAYVAFKTWDHSLSVAERYRLLTDISEMTPGQAKRFGKGKQHPEWTDIRKTECMNYLLKQKFSNKNPTLKQMLIDTGDSYLEETNTWGDTFWGVCDGVGENVLGNLLMNIRDELIHYGN